MASVSDRLIYEKNKPSVPSQSMITQLYPTSGKDCDSGTKIVLEIPTGGGAPGQNLIGNMSYLKFDYKNKGDGAVELPYGGVKGLFQKVELYSAGKLVQSHDNYGDWNAAMRDVGTTTAQNNGTEALTTGQQEGNRKGVSVASGASKTLCCEIPSMILNQEKAIPTYALTGGLRLEITLAVGKNGGVWASGATESSCDYALNDFVANFQYSQVSAEAHSLIAGQNGSEIHQSLQLWETYTDTITTGDTASSNLIPCRKNSIKTILSSWKNATPATGKEQDGLSRFRLQLNTYNYVINGKNAPVVPVTGSETKGHTAMAMEVCRAFHSVSGVKNGRLGANYETDDARTQDSTFLIAIDLEGTPNKSNSSFSGVNTVSAPPQLQAQFNNPGATLQGLHHIQYDCIMSVSNGGMSIDY